MMTRFAIILVAVGCFLAVTPVGAGEAVSGPRPVRPRPGAVFGYAKDLPRIEFSWKESGRGNSYILQIVRVSGRSSEVATYLVNNRTNYTVQPQKTGKFRWWVASIGPDGKPSRPGPSRYFRVAAGAAPAKPGKRQVAPKLIQIKPEKPKQEKPAPREVAPKVAKAEPVLPKPPPEKKEPATEPKVTEDFDPALAPVLQAPGNGAQIVTDKPRKVLLFWKPVGGARSYEVVMGISKDLSGQVTRRVVKGSMLALPKPPNGTTFWRVRALNEAGKQSSWSATWKFDYQEHGMWGD